MTNNTAPAALTLEEKIALENVQIRPAAGISLADHFLRSVGLHGSTSPIGPGSLLVTHSRGATRLVVVEKVGPKRVSVVYTTAGAIKTAQDIIARNMTVQPNPKAVEKTVRSNYRFTETMADGTNELYARFYTPDSTFHTPERKAQEMAKYQAELAEMEAQGGVEAAVARAIEADARYVAACRQDTNYLTHVHFTRKSVSHNDAYLLAEEN